MLRYLLVDTIRLAHNVQFRTHLVHELYSKIGVAVAYNIHETPCSMLRLRPHYLL